MPRRAEGEVASKTEDEARMQSREGRLKAGNSATLPPFRRSGSDGSPCVSVGRRSQLFDIKNFRDILMKKEIRLTVVGKVLKPNKKKILALNRCLEEYFNVVKWYLSFNSTSKSFLHKNGYEKAKRLFNLNTALI
ncbi:MAG: hypothetical protein J7L50_02130, partial [Candidatus Odinarchaeota archaeon]|nr:hypothetical protein [Candidatus Odinarchaeota archaeon]